MNFICNICNEQYILTKNVDNRYHCPCCGDYLSTSSFVSIYAANPNIKIAYHKIKYYYIPICYNNNLYMVRGNNRTQVYEKPNISIFTCPIKASPAAFFNGKSIYQGDFFAPSMEQAIQDIANHAERLLNLLVFT